MGLTMAQRQAVTRQTAQRYRRSSKKGKGIILEEFVALTGYNRSYAATVLRSGLRKTHVRKRPRPSQRRYGDAVIGALVKVWLILDSLCGKRLAQALPEVVPRLIQHGELSIDAPTQEALMRMSASTIDRLLAPARKKQQFRTRGGTKPGTLIKGQIPVRTFSQWDEARPGFVELDLVQHEGGNPTGDFAQTLDVTDVHTGWTETEAVQNKAQIWVFGALQNIQGRLPFPLLGIDSDNGSEFINSHLLRYCQAKHITFTRARSGRKNDNCFVEQKNYTIVRKSVGYLRYDTAQELEWLNELYGYLRLYTNFFLPVMKLQEKIRMGSKVRKRYDCPRTPYHRVLESPHVSQDKKDSLRNLYSALNPAELKRQILRLQNRLIDFASQKDRRPTTHHQNRSPRRRPVNYILGKATNYNPFK